MSEAKTTLADGSPVTEDHRQINPATGMQKDYVVLSAEERAKGFVRPVRRTYIHVGRSVCGKIRVHDGQKLGGPQDVCVLPPGHEGECTQWKGNVPQAEAQKAQENHVLGGCGTSTTMSQSIAETYARQPDFYGSTFCCHCRTHIRVGEHGEFVWEDGSRVGS